MSFADMRESGEQPPVPLGMPHLFGKIRSAHDPEQHRRVVMEAAEQGVSVNQLLISRV